MAHLIMISAALSAPFIMIGLVLPDHVELISALGILVLACIEEVLFRYYLFMRHVKTVGYIKPMLLSSLAFSFAHLPSGASLAGVFFIFGLMMCIIYLAFSNILLIVAIHFSNNSIVASRQNSLFGSFVSRDLAIGVYVILLLLVFLLAAITIYKSHRKKL